MANPTTLPGDLVVPGNARISGSISPTLTKANVLSVEERVKPLPLSIWRIWDNFVASLPAAPATDDLGLVGGTFATNHPSIQTVDFGGTTSTAYARALIEVPEDYVASQTFKIRFHGGMHTTVADTTCTLDCVVHEIDKDRTVTADLASAASANNINSLTYADVDFTITDDNLAPGDMLDVRIEIDCNDAGNLGADIRGVIGAVQLVYNGR